ncbi:E3 ubiquitin-protein ligase trim23 [Desmophyllum pertusum]|uniref:RING-type E3 ubiquitin transferase n=1 Tax=Desmophyllum pertusum TaxID=174260 RepID=A0A9W9YHQ1_9CNID|nr:E3 ubiquitin-protein ligase trim23 [Desmophyllum pertusum]
MTLPRTPTRRCIDSPLAVSCLSDYCLCKLSSAVEGGVKVLDCRVCEDVFTLQGDKVPRLLLCGHTVCHDCLTRLPVHGRKLHCPFDRQSTELGDSGVWGLKKNFALLELLERLQVLQEPLTTCDNESRDDTVRCDENDEHIANIYCTVCETNLCSDCAESTHSTKTL